MADGNRSSRKVRKLIVGDANDVSQAIGKCSLVFRRLKWKRKIKELESSYAKAGIPVFLMHRPTGMLIMSQC